jgi:hypothetical protein
VVHREFIGNVTGSVAFAVGNTFAVQPGLAASFPWLATIAQNWETYRFRKLHLCYYTRTGSNVPGSVIMAHDPDASDAAPSTEQVMASYANCQEDAPWKDICLKLDLKALNDLGPRKFVRTGALAANQDIKLYDSGNAYVAGVDGTAVNWGKLWFEYDVEFFTPQLPPTGDVIPGGLITGGGTLTAANPLGTVPVLDTSSAGLSIASAGAASIVTFTNPGTYLLSAYFTAASVGGVPNLAAGAGATVSTSATVGVVPIINNAAGTNGSITWLVVTTVQGASVTLTINTFTTPTLCQVRVTSCPDGSQA